MWQYTKDGTLAGINAAVDMNYKIGGESTDPAV